MLWIPIVFIIIIIYFHIYIHFCINSENELLSLNDVCKEEITSFIYKKLPFYLMEQPYERNLIYQRVQRKITNIMTYLSQPMNHYLF